MHNLSLCMILFSLQQRHSCVVVLLFSSPGSFKNRALTSQHVLRSCHHDSRDACRLVAPSFQALLERSRSLSRSFVDSFVARTKGFGTSPKMVGCMAIHVHQQLVLPYRGAQYWSCQSPNYACGFEMTKQFSVHLGHIWVDISRWIMS